MINEVSSKITNYIENNSGIGDTNSLDRINYALQAILGDLFKFLILSTIFLILGKINFFLFSMIILFSSRIFIGGYHCKSITSCLLTSLILFLITSLIGPMLPRFYTSVYYTVLLLSFLIVIFNAPFPNIKRPIKCKKRRQTLKILSIFSLIFWTTILLFIIDDTTYLNCGFLTIILEVIQIFFLRKESQYAKIP